jgi:hypothetical protein
MTNVRVAGVAVFARPLRVGRALMAAAEVGGGLAA